MTRVARTDISTLQPCRRRADGTVIADAHLTRCGVFSYMQPDGTIRRELRRPEDVNHPDSLKSFEGVPVTNNHPPGMIDAKNARQYSVGAVCGAVTRDDSHVRGTIAVHDADTIAQMDAGKTQLSCGYTCDTEETPGIDPMYGAYDAVQRRIVGNHVALVDRGRAGITAAARMDGMMVEDSGTGVAKAPGLGHTSCMVAIPSARIDVVVRHDQGLPSATAQVDPNDEASRNARGANNASTASKEQPGQMADRTGDTVHGATIADPPEQVNPEVTDDDDDEDGEGQDAYDASYVDGELTAAARDKIKASNFAVPGKEKLPIHDKSHVKAAMSRFGQTDFESADEKHAAFNRIKSKAKQLGVGSAGFEKAHAGKLDRLDHKEPTSMTADEIKALRQLSDERKSRVDALDAELAKANGQIANLTKELDAAKTAPRTDAEDVIAARVDAKVALMSQATATGAKVDAKMSDTEIKRTVIKHVDGDDVPADKHAEYVNALYEGAVKRSHKDAIDTARGAAAIGAVRVATETVRADGNKPALSDEDAAKQKMRSDSFGAWTQPSKARKETR